MRKMRKSCRYNLASLAVTLTAFAAVAVTQDADLSLGEMAIPEYGVGGLAPKTTVYPVAEAGSTDPKMQLAAGGNWALEAWTIGRTLGEQPDDFRIGETCTALPEGKIDWVKTYAANNPTNHPGLVFNLDATNETERVIFTRTGPVSVEWVMAEGESPVKISYQIGRSVSARPYRLYATRADEGNLVAYVDLSGKYVRFFGDPNLVEKKEYGGANGMTNTIVRGLDYNAQSGLLTYRYTVDEKTGEVNCPQGQMVMAYYDTESKERMVSRIVVEVTAPRVNTLTAHVGEELRPLGGGFGIAGLSPAVNSGTQVDADDPCSPYVEVYETPQSTASGDEKGQLKLYALAPTDASTSKLGMDMPWKVDVYWRAPDPMGTLWTFEDDWYLVTWPDSAPQVVTSGDAANPGYPLVLPSTYSASVLNYRRPLHLNVSYDDSTHRVTAEDEGRFVLRLTVGEDGQPYFLPVECVKRTDSRVCAENPLLWPVGREITLCRGEMAGSAAAVAAKMDASLPGYIHLPGSQGRNWNPKLYHFDSGSAVDGMLGSVTENNAFASLVSSIYGVNESAYPIEVWWSGSYKGDKAKGNALPEPVTYPGFVQKFKVNWALAELEDVYPTIHLYSQKGSADETMTAVQSLGLHFSESNSSATVTKELGVRFKSYERLHLGFSVRSLQLDEKVLVVRPGRIATVRSTANRRVALEIAVTEADANGYTVVTSGAGFETSSNRYDHLVWNDYAVEVPPKLADTQLEVSFGSTGVNGEPAAVNIALDDLACWHGESYGAKDVDNAEFYFAFAEEDAEAGEAQGLADALQGKTVAAVLGACSLTCRNCDFTLGAPEPYYGLFAAENGIAPEIYYENDEKQIGYNPNEEHALMEKTDDGYVAWALRNDLNFEDTSHAMIFVQYAENGKGRMAPFRIGAVPGQVTDEDYRQSKDEPESDAPSGDGNGQKRPTPNPPDPHAAGAFTNEVVVGSPLIVPKPLRLLTNSGTAKDTAHMAIWRSKDANPVYKDRKNQFWARRDGLVDVNYYYPLQSGKGFYVPTIEKGGLKDGTFIGWMNNVGKGRPTANQVSNDVSKAWTWKCKWPEANAVPTMKIGQVLTKPEADLPEMWNAASMAVTYPQLDERGKGIVDLIDPTAAQTASLKITSSDFPSEFGFSVGSTGNCTLRKGKYYFTGCPPSVSERFYIDVNAAEEQRMVLIGDLVEKESGGSYLRLNVLSGDERKALKDLCKLGNNGVDSPKARWDKAVDNLAKQAKKVSMPAELPNRGLLEMKKEAVFVFPTTFSDTVEKKLKQGYEVLSSGTNKVVTASEKGLNKAVWKITQRQKDYHIKKGTPEYEMRKKMYETEVKKQLCDNKPWPNDNEVRIDIEYGTFTWLTDDRTLAIPYGPKDHLALIATGANYNDGWVTLIENDDPDPTHVAEGLPVKMHVIRVVKDLHLDGIAVVNDSLNKLSEQLSLLYKSPLGDAAEDFEFEWRRRKPSDNGTIDTDYGNWDVYKRGKGLTSLLLGTKGADPDEYVNTYYTLRYHRANDKDGWTGYAPPQLAEGWLQRVLNSVTPFAQRVEDFYANPSDINFTMLEQIGKPYTGDVALNNDNLPGIGLMELYQTLFNRVETMISASGGGEKDLSKQLILAATRLNEFYSLLGAEAYSDAKNPLIGSADGTAFPAGTFSFANQVPTLLDEELALLRGRAASTQFPRMTESPCFNRLVWNFTKGITEGEPAYVNNYGIRARDGIMDVNCAAAQYPQGHGDAWGHYLSAVKIYYRLLRNPKFDWTTSMTEMLMDQKIVNVDYQDEQKFADAAAKLAQTGLDAFDLSLRKAYREKSGSSEQGGGSSEEGGARVWSAGFFDSNTNQAFGCGEWATRTEMGAVYNWMVGNALLPSNDTPYQAFTDRGIKKIDRTTALSLSSLCTVVDTLDKKLADNRGGMNPLGLAEGAIPFDIDPDELALKNSHFEQILARAEKSLANCRTVLDYANVYGSRLRQLQEEETEAIAEREKTEQSYNNQLIAIYGTPFPGDIGAGGTYPQGYEGPDLYNYNCMDLAPFGLSEADLKLAYSTNLWLYKNSDLLAKTNGTVKVTFTVSAGGIRMPNANMTGIRATEGSLQQKYREYLNAYVDYTGKVTDYDTKVTLMNNAALKARTTVAQSYITEFLKVAIAGCDQVVKETAFEAEKDRWSNLMSQLNYLRKTVSATTGITIAGTATGGDVQAQAKVKALEAWNKSLTNGQNDYAAASNAYHTALAEYSATNQISLSYTLLDADNAKLEELFNKYGGLINLGSNTVDRAKDNTNAKTLSTILTWVNTLFNQAFNMSNTYRDQSAALNAAIREVRSAAYSWQSAVTALANAEAAYRAELYKGELLQDERAQWRQRMSNEATASRYADMFNRVQRNIALTKYSTAFDTAQRYVWELAKVYDYETGLLSSDEKSGTQFLADIVATRSLGVEGVPIASGTTDGGLYDVVARMKANWDVLEGRLGINNPDKPTKWFSLRHDNYRIGLSNSVDQAWQRVLANSIVADIGSDADFRRHCQPLALSASASQGPAIVLTFETSIWGDKNFFGNPLVPGNEQFSAADYATKIDAVGVYFQGYDEHAVAGGLFVREPNVYLVPIGIDCMRSPAGTDDREVLGWSVVDQVLPLPYAIGSTELDDPSWISTFSGSGGSAANIRRHSTLRMGYNLTSNRLVGRSAWNTKWMLVIPARSLGSDQESILVRFAEKVKDIKLGIRAYSRQGN